MCSVGVKLAESLGLSVGDEVVLVGQAYDGSIASARAPVRGIFRTKINEYDGYVVVMPLGAVREFSCRAGRGNGDRAALEGSQSTRRRTHKAGRALGERYEVVGWPTLIPVLATSLRYHEVLGYVTLAIFFVIVAAGVANPVLMSVLERTREFGVMLAVGMSPSRLLRVVL